MKENILPWEDDFLEWEEKMDRKQGGEARSFIVDMDTVRRVSLRKEEVREMKNFREGPCDECGALDILSELDGDFVCGKCRLRLNNL